MAPEFQVPQFVVPPEGISFKDVITDFEKQIIESTLDARGGVQSGRLSCCISSRQHSTR